MTILKANYNIHLHEISITCDSVTLTHKRVLEQNLQSMEREHKYINYNSAPEHN